LLDRITELENENKALGNKICVCLKSMDDLRYAHTIRRKQLYDNISNLESVIGDLKDANESLKKEKEKLIEDADLLTRNTPSYQILCAAYTVLESKYRQEKAKRESMKASYNKMYSEHNCLVSERRKLKNNDVLRIIKDMIINSGLHNKIENDGEVPNG